MNTLMDIFHCIWSKCSVDNLYNFTTCIIRYRTFHHDRQLCLLSSSSFRTIIQWYWHLNRLKVNIIRESPQLSVLNDICGMDSADVHSISFFFFFFTTKRIYLHWLTSRINHESLSKSPIMIVHLYTFIYITLCKIIISLNISL